MTQFIQYIIISFLLASCRPASPIKPTQKIDSSKNSLSYFSKKPTKYYYNYDMSKSNIDNFDSGYVDTFVINDIHFRLLSNPDSESNLEMQVFENGNWAINFKTIYADNGNDCEDDINNDGFNDFQQSMRNGTYVFLFDDKLKRFTDTMINVALHHEILNKKENIHYQLWQPNSPEWSSDLYKFIGLKQEFLYTLKCIESDKEFYSAGSMRLYKCLNGNLEDTVLVKEFILKENYYDFNFEKYWIRILHPKKGYR